MRAGLGVLCRQFVEVSQESRREACVRCDRGLGPDGSGRSPTQAAPAHSAPLYLSARLLLSYLPHINLPSQLTTRTGFIKMGCFDWFRFTRRKIVPSRVPAEIVKSPSLTSSSASSVMDSTAQDCHNRPSTCFTCTRMNSSTFRIVEADKYGEVPFIYAKIYNSVIVLIDTGCGGAARDPGAKLTSLRHFIEEYPVEDNTSKPLNPGGSRSYVVLCTHCHYDHIGVLLALVSQSSVSPTSTNSYFARGHCPIHRPTQIDHMGKRLRQRLH